MPSFFKRGAIMNAGSAFIGITLPLTAAIWYVSGSGDDFKDRISPDSAAEAVVQRLPQVAVIGQKTGPADTTEVFIQVPGVMNMQSVYVLSDGKTVISGFVLPDMERGGVPGGQLTMPNGQASVNASDEREGLEQLLTLIRDNPQVRNQVMTLAEASEESAQSGGGQDTAADTLPSPTSAPAVENRSEPSVAGQSELPAPEPVEDSQPQDNSPERSATADMESVPTVPEVPPVNRSAAVPVTSNSGEDAEIPSPSTASPGSQVSGQESTTESEVNGDALSDLTVTDVAGAAAFANHLKGMLTSDPEIEAIRSITEPQKQQKAYLEYVKERPAITQGSGPRHLYVLFDANCPVCHKYYQQIKPKVDRGQLTIHWIPVVVFPDLQRNRRRSDAVTGKRWPPGAGAADAGQHDAKPGIHSGTR